MKERSMLLVFPSIPILKRTNFEGYNIADSFSRRHGDVAVIVRNGLKCQRMHKIHKMSIENHIELAAVHLVTHKLLVMTVHRPPTTNFDTLAPQLNRCLEDITESTCYKICVAGDFNFDLLKQSHSREKLLKIF
ncbi:hypothetical protein HHI36_000486 [Cryptolaemus montrouzieri]|uniref:Endonuclease/exonuclease/phosphatase domain-containing protein n=1 Tax=Cryptolaemus montrouzieri TaxID=559131 RepID=A0ABD2P5H7_9CUCU